MTGCEFVFNVLAMRRFLLALCLLSSLSSLLADPTPEARATVVIFNSSNPESAALAQYYAQQREIPADQVVGIPCSADEEISRKEYTSTIAKPVLELFQSKGWWTTTPDLRVTDTKIRFVALIRGMPLKVRSDLTGDIAPLSRDEASVDSELACLGFGPIPTAGPIKNPFANRLSAIVDAITEPGLLLVCRLDGASDKTVRAMIDNGLAAEKTGLWGWAYIDSRGLKDGPYVEGDNWLTAAATQLRQAGVPVLWDKAPETLPLGYPVTDAALYYGWYDGQVSGPFADQEMRFTPGAVAVHIHSFSAMTIRNPGAYWCAPLLERGASATVGNVYEPYLTLTTHLDVFQDRLINGFTFAESSYMAQTALSWMNVSIGDPLYRPYAAWKTSQVKNVWTQYRQIIDRSAGSFVMAAPKLLDAAKKTGNSMFLESLAAQQADEGNLAEALKSVEAGIALEKAPLIKFRLGWEKLSLLGALGKQNEAKAYLLTLLASAPGLNQTNLLQAVHSRYFAVPTPAPAP